MTFFFYILVDTPGKHFSVIGGLLLKNLQLCSTVIKFAVMSFFRTVKFERRRHRTSLQTEQRKVKWRRIHNPGGRKRLRSRFSKRPFPDKRLVSSRMVFATQKKLTGEMYLTVMHTVEKQESKND